jgi:hypothetical protein
MKTAMQELLDDIQKHIKVDWPMNIVIRTAINNALEKEKEQIIDAYTEGYTNWDSEMTSIEYYNQTYNNGEN